VKISKKSLLDAIDTALTKDDERRAEYARATEIWQVRRRKQWLANKEPQWRQVRDTLTRKLNRKEPITVADLKVLTNKQGYRQDYFSEHTFAEKVSPPNPIKIDGQAFYQPSAPVEDLLALKVFLEGSLDEAFSMESLSRLGFKAPAWVFRAAAAR
jgi:hypothetical protein